MRSWVEEDCIIDNSLLLGADYSQTQHKRAMGGDHSLPIGIGRNTIIRRAIVDKNARIGSDVRIENQQGHDHYDDPEGRYYIRNGIVVIPKNTEIASGTVI